MHVLIIEDDLLLALDLEDCLTGHLACTTSLASTENQACKSADGRRPDLIVSDIRLADGDGTRAVARIRAAHGEIPAIYVTANPERARAEDPEAPVIAKPFGHADLAEASARLLQGRER